MIDTFAYLPVHDFGNAFSTYIAQNYGDGNTDRVRRGIHPSLADEKWTCPFFHIP